MGNCVCKTDVLYDDVTTTCVYQYPKLEIDQLMEEITDEVILEFKWQRLPSCPRNVVTFKQYT